MAKTWLNDLTDAKEFLGYPLALFEECSYLYAHGVVNKNRSLGWPDHSGYVACFRIKKEKCKIAKWWCL